MGLCHNGAMGVVLRNLSRRAKPFRYAGYLGLLGILLLRLSEQGPSLAVGVAAAYCVVWPGLVDWLQQRFPAQSLTLRLHVAEGVNTGALLGALGLPIMPAAAVVTALLVGNAALAGRGLMAKVAMALCAGYASCWGFAAVPAIPVPVSQWVAAALLVAYSVALGQTCFAQAQRLHGLQFELKKRSEVLHALNCRLGRYVPGGLQSRIAAAPQQRCQLERRWLTVAFVDVVGFTQLADGLAAEALASVLNDYYSALARATDEHQGTLAKMQGDGALLYFGDDDRGRLEGALACARLVAALPRMLRGLSARWHGDGYLVSLQVRAGIASGYCSLGDWGEERLDFTVIGGPVNLAQRLQTQASANGVLVSAVSATLLRQEIGPHIGPPRTLELGGIGAVTAFPLVDLSDLSANVPPA